MYPKMHYANPAVWSFLRTGLVDVDDNLVDIGMLAKHRKRLGSLTDHPSKTWEKGIEGLIATVPEDDFITVPSPVLRPRKVVEEERPFWTTLSAHCQKQEVGQFACCAIYEWMAENFWHPGTVGTEIGEVALKECYVTQSSTLGTAALGAKVPAVVLSPDACAFWLRCGALDLESYIQIDILSKDDIPVPLIEVVPEFGEILTEEGRETALVRFVSGLGLRIAGKPVKQPCILEARELLLDREQFDGLTWKAQRTLLIEEAINAKWFSGDAAQALKQLFEHSVLRLRRWVAEGHDLPDRLLRAVRNEPKRLLDSFDDGTRSAITGNISKNGRRLAELALHVHGPAVLDRLSEALQENGLRPPGRWGTQDARDFVAAINFPPEFSVSARQKRPAELTVSGPMPLGDLHPYQIEIVDELESVVAERGPQARAIISLPTGAGKTRVAVEASVKYVLAASVDVRWVLWVAQTDELCEQAVQSFRQVWRNCGQDWTELRIVRLWGANPDPTPSADDAPTAAISTIQTLTSRLGRDRPGLLEACALGIIEKSHHAITPTLTRHFDWFLP